MPTISPISDLCNNANEISGVFRSVRNRYLLKNVVVDMVVLSIGMYECQQAQIELYLKLTEAEAEIALGVEGVDFFEIAKRLRTDVHGTV